MSVRYVVGDAVWPEIEEAAAKVGKRRTVLAVAFVTRTDWLDTKPGDLVLVDATDRAVAMGMTRPKALARWIRSGAEVYSIPGLHAKTYVLGLRVVVGSANASESGLVEAAVAFTGADAKPVREVAVAEVENLRDVFLLNGQARRLTKAWAKAAEKRYATKRPRGGTLPAAAPSLLPNTVRRVWLLHTVPYDWPPRLTSAEKAGHRRARRLTGPASDFEMVALPDDEGAMALGDVVVELRWPTESAQDGVVVWSPSTVVEVSPPVRGGQRVIWLRRDPLLPTRTAEEFQRASGIDPGRDGSRRVNGEARRRAVLAVWGLPKAAGRS